MTQFILSHAFLARENAFNSGYDKERQKARNRYEAANKTEGGA